MALFTFRTTRVSSGGPKSSYVLHKDHKESEGGQALGDGLEVCCLQQRMAECSDSNYVVRARCTTLKAARASATNFARATLRKFATGFLFKLFNAQFLDFASLRVLFLVVGSFFNVYLVI